MPQLTPTDAELIAAQTLATRYGLSPSGYDLVHRGVGLVFEIDDDHRPLVLKLTDGVPETLNAQLSWQGHLANHGIRVARSLVSSGGNLVESIPGKGVTYLGYVTERLPLDDESRIDRSVPEQVNQLGRTMARMHVLGESYLQTIDPYLFHDVLESLWLVAPHEMLHPSQAHAADAMLELSERIEWWPRDESTFGLVHDDLHDGNVFVLRSASGDGELALLDFDCTHRNWYAADIASALLFRVWIAPGKLEMLDIASGFLQELLKGYRTVRPVPFGLAGMLPDLLKLREISLFATIYENVDVEHTDDETALFVYHSITENRPFLDLDWNTLIG